MFTIMNHPEIYQLLKYRRQELCSRLQSIKNDFTSCEDMDDVLFTIAHETKVELANTKTAIEQIEQGNYGICINCNSPISDDLLNEKPLTKLCQHCLSL